MNTSRHLSMSVASLVFGLGLVLLAHTAMSHAGAEYTYTSLVRLMDTKHRSEDVAQSYILVVGVFVLGLSMASVGAAGVVKYRQRQP